MKLLSEKPPFRKLLWILVGLVIFLAALAPLPFVIESRIAHSLDLKGIRKSLAQASPDGAPYRLRFQGIRFELQKGIILNGVRLYYQKDKTSGGPQERLIFRAENLILEYSLLRKFSGRPPVIAIHFQNGEWLDRLHSHSPLFSMIEDLMRLSQRQDSFLFADHPTLFFHQIRIQPKSDRKNPTRFVLNLDLEARRTQDRLSVRLKLAPKGRDSYLKIRGYWEKSQTGVFRFRLHRLPVSVFWSLLGNVPTVSSQSDFGLSGFTWEEGRITGKGSIQFYPKKGTGFDIKAQVVEPRFALSLDKARLAQIAPKELHLSYNAGWKVGEGYSFINFRLKHPDLLSDFSYRSQALPEVSRDPKQPTDRVLLKGFVRLRPDNGIRISGIHSSEKMEFHASLSLPSGSRVATQSFHIRGQKIRLHTALPNRKPLILDTFTLDSKEPATQKQGKRKSEHNALLSIRAHRGPSTIALTGTGNVQFYKASGKAPPLIAAQDWMLELAFKNWSYVELARDALYLHRQLITKGSQKDAPRAEDLGPLWQAKFRKTPIYLGLVERLAVRLHARFTKMQDAGGLPTELDATGRLKNGYADLRVDSRDGSSKGKWKLRYKLDLARNIPFHDLSLELKNPENKTPLAFLTGSPVPPRSYFLRYFMSGEGWLAADIVHRSYSRIEVRASDLQIQNPRMLKLLNYGSSQNLESFPLTEFLFRYGTDGPKVSLFADAGYAEGGRITLRATNKLGDFGSGSLRFVHRTNKQRSERTIRLRFTPRQTWKPEL